MSETSWLSPSVSKASSQGSEASLALVVHVSSSGCCVSIALHKDASGTGSVGKQLPSTGCFIPTLPVSLTYAGGRRHESGVEIALHIGHIVRSSITGTADL